MFRVKCKRRLVCVMVWLTALMLCGVGQAQEGAIDIQNFQPVASPYGIFTTDSSKVHGALEVSGGLLLNLAKDPLVLVPDNGDPTTPIVDQQLVGDLMFAIGLFDVAELDIALPLYFVNEGAVEGAAFEGSTPGDLRLRPKLKVLDAEEGLVGLGFFVQVGLPTGDDAAFTSSGSVYARPGVIVDTRIDRLMLSANLTANLQEERTFSNLDVGSQLLYNAGLEYQVVEETFLVGAEIFGSSSFDEFLSSYEEAPLEGLLGLKLRTSAGINFEMGAGGGLISGFGAPAYRVFGGIRYAEYSNDWDNDGIVNKIDGCPRVPEDLDGFEDENGCPDPDNDKDEIPDLSDNCPNEPEDKDEFEDSDGCPDPDNDGDTVLDVDDACPNTPGVVNLQGCPDRDADGIADASYKCPDTPGVVKYEGCPEPDSDGDGILDVSDKCPNDPEDKDGFEDSDGCPDGDNDKDRVCDPWVEDTVQARKMTVEDAKKFRAPFKCVMRDECPLRPGKPKFKGCPGKKQVVVVGDEIKILKKVFFNTGSAVIKRESYSLLDEVASTIIGTPSLKKIEIQGHTDDVGNDRANEKLSADRAASVRTYLIDKGVNANILTSRGFGESVPAKSIEGLRGKALRDARSENRRVQFKILEQERKTKVIEVDPNAP